MIEHYTIKFGPAVSQKELEKSLNEELTPEQVARLHLMKGRIDFICDYSDIKTLVAMLKSLGKSGAH
jgi:hypothetical protein